MSYEEPTVDEMLDLFDDIVREHITTGGNYALPMRSDDEKEFLESIAPLRALIASHAKPQRVTRDQFDGLINQLVICAFGLGVQVHINSQVGLKIREILTDTFADLGIEVVAEET